MERMIVIPGDLRDRSICPWMEFIDKISIEEGFEVVYADRIDFPHELKGLIVYGVPQHNRQYTLANDIRKLGADVKIVGWMQDLQTYGQEFVKREMDEMLDRYDKIIAYRREDFYARYPQHKDKFCWVPNWVYNSELYSALPFNENPICRFTLSGNTNKDVYPLRHAVKISNHPDVEVFGTFTYNQVQYAKINNMYLGGITCASKYETALKKHFEIPAAGGLLVSNGCKDMEELGFRHNENFIDLTQVNEHPLKVVEVYMRRPELCKNVRLNGRNFVLKNHNSEKRYRLWKQAVMETISSSGQF